MHFPQVRCYYPNGSQQPHTFYILSKGENAGKPGFQPWCNSFQVVCTNEYWFNFHYWLVYGLFKAGKFKIYQRGSVIPFINKSDVQDLLNEIAPEIYPHWDKYQQIVEALNKLEKRKIDLAEHLKATENLQSSLIRSYFAQLK